MQRGGMHHDAGSGGAIGALWLVLCEKDEGGKQDPYLPQMLRGCCMGGGQCGCGTKIQGGLFHSMLVAPAGCAHRPQGWGFLVKVGRRETPYA